MGIIIHSCEISMKIWGVIGLSIIMGEGVRANNSDTN